MKITDFYEGYSDAPQKLRFLTILCKSVLIFDRFLLFVPDARQLLMQKSYDFPCNITFWGRCVLYHWGSKTQKKSQKEQISSKNVF